MSRVEAAGLRRLEQDDDEVGLLAYCLEGKATTEQGEEFFGRVQAAHDAGRKVRMYYELIGFPSAEMGVVLEKFKHIGAMWNAIERMAIVGDQGWLGIYTKLVDPITKPDIRHFKADEKDAALAWLRE
jgi:hypothetical protein